MKKPSRSVPEATEGDSPNHDFDRTSATPQAEPAAPPTAPTKPNHPSRLLSLARQLDISQEDIDAFSTERLQDLVHYLSSNQLKQLRQAAPSPAAAPEAEPNYAFEGEEDVAEPIVRAIKELKKEHHQTRKELAEARARLQAQTTENAQDIADRVFSENADFFGSGKGRSMDASDPQFQRRFAAYEIARADTSSRSVEDKIRAAMAVLTGAPAKKPSRSRQEEWDQEGAVSKPTQRESAKPKGRALAAKAVGEVLKRVNGSVDDDSESYESW